jgi:hypothetical protein
MRKAPAARCLDSKGIDVPSESFSPLNDLNLNFMASLWNYKSTECACAVRSHFNETRAGNSLSQIIMKPKQDEIDTCEQFYPGTSQALRLKRVTVHMAASDSL